MPHGGPAYPIPGFKDALYLLLLAVGCTLLPYTLALVALRLIRAFDAQIALNLTQVALTAGGGNNERYSGKFNINSFKYLS